MIIVQQLLCYLVFCILRENKDTQEPSQEIVDETIECDTIFSGNLKSRCIFCLGRICQTSESENKLIPNSSSTVIQKSNMTCSVARFNKQKIVRKLPKIQKFRGRPPISIRNILARNTVKKDIYGI